MGNDLCPEHWRLGVGGQDKPNGIWELDLSADWSIIERTIGAGRQYQEQAWLPWQLWQAYTAFRFCNDRSVLYYGRAILGAALGDDELLGGQLTNRCS
jgi:hypothetical protein